MRKETAAMLRHDAAQVQRMLECARFLILPRADQQKFPTLGVGLGPRVHRRGWNPMICLDSLSRRHVAER